MSRFFIVGCPRSGTTLLSVLLDRHSRLCVTPETGFYDEIAPRLSRLHTWRRLPELGLTPEEVPTEGNVLEAILDLYAKKRGKARSGEKTPQHLLHVPEILRDFPDAKIVCIIRDGRDNALSLHAMPWWRGSLRSAAKLWAKCARLAAQYAAHDAFLLVRYEDLVADSRGVLSRVMAHLGETFEESQLDVRVSSATVLPRSLEWKGQALQPIDANEPGRRRSEATARQIAVIEAIAGRELQLHGYAIAPARSIAARIFGF